MQVSNVILELDVKLVCDAFYSENLDIYKFGMIIEECRALLQSQNFILCHVCRQVNAIADILEKAASNLLNPSSSLKAPLFIRDRLAFDVINSV